MTILKKFYDHNPTPKREELERISSKIGHPFKVVKVWFKNSRRLERREGKSVVNQPSNPLGTGLQSGDSSQEPLKPGEPKHVENFSPIQCNYKS